MLEGFHCTAGTVSGRGFIRLLLLEGGSVDLRRATERLRTDAAGPSQETLRWYASSWKTVLGGESVYDARRRLLRLPPGTTSDLQEFRAAREAALRAHTRVEAVALLERAEAVWLRSEREHARQLSLERRNGDRRRDVRGWGPLAEDYARLVLVRIAVRLELSSLRILLGGDLDQVATRIEAWLAEPPAGLEQVRDAGLMADWHEMRRALLNRRVYARYSHLAPLTAAAWDGIRADVREWPGVDDPRVFEDFLARRRHHIIERLVENDYTCEPADEDEPATELMGRRVDRRARPRAGPRASPPPPPREVADRVIPPWRADNATRQDREEVGREARLRLHPPEPEPLVGREVERGRLLQAIELEHFPIQVHGGPGTGKSALVAGLARPGESATFWIDLAVPGLVTATAVKRLLGRALSLRRAGERSGTLVRDLRETLAGQPEHLIVLDNVEATRHTALIEGLQAVTPRLVICTRQQFRLPGHPEALHCRLDRLHGLGERLWARLGGPTGDDEALHVICHDHLADHPYAIVLTATAARSLQRRSGTHHWAELRERLSACHRAGDADHHELRTAFRHSLVTLPEPARLLLAELAVCAPSGVGTEWLEAQAAATDGPVDEPLQELVDRRLVRTLVDDRHTWHPMLVEHTAHLLQTPHRHHLDAAASYALRHGDDFPRLERERDNLVLAVQRAAQLRRWDALMALWRTLAEWLETTGDHNAMAALEDLLLVEDGAIPAVARAHALFSRALRRPAALRIGSLLLDLQEALRIARREADHTLAARALVALWTYESEVIGKDLEDVRLQEAMRLTVDHRLGPGLTAEVSYWRGWSCHQRGHAADAELWLHRAIDHAADHPRCPYGAMARHLLGEIALADGDLETACRHLETARDMPACRDIPRVTGMVWEGLARLQQAGGAGDDGALAAGALELLRTAERAYSDTGDDTAAVRAIAAQLALVSGADRAEALRRATAITAAIPHPRRRATALCTLGFALAASGQGSVAARHVHEAGPLLAEPDLTDDEVGAMAHEQGLVWLRLREFDAAVIAARIAIERRQSAAAPAGDLPSARDAVLAESLGLLGDALRSAGDSVAALDAYQRCAEMVRRLPRAVAWRQSLVLWQSIAELHITADRPDAGREAHLIGARLCEQLIAGGSGEGRRGSFLHRWRAEELRAAGRPEEALAAYREAAACLEVLAVPPADELARLRAEEAALQADL